MAHPWTVLALTPLPPEHLTAMFADQPIRLVVPVERSSAALLALAPDADIILGGWTSDLAVSAELVAAASRLVLVQQPSAGVDTIDVDACSEAAVPVANAGGANAVSVAEWCVGSAFAVLRSMAHADREMRLGRWPQLELSQRGGGELTGRRVGVVGMGQIGRECAQRFVALGCDVAHWSRTKREPAAAGGAPWLPLEDLLRRSDVLVVLIALSPETDDLIGAEELAMLPPGAFVINAARGGIVNEAALLAAISSGAVAGGALDVYTTEPLPTDSPLRAEDRLLLSPHAAAATGEAVQALFTGFVDNIKRAVAGEPVINVVNRADLPDFDGIIRRRET